MQVCRNQNGCQLVTSFFDDPHKLLFLADYVILSKTIFRFHIPVTKAVQSLYEK